MNRQGFLFELEKIMEIQPRKLELNTQLSDFNEWDSMTILGLISFIDNKFNKKITMDTIKKFKKVEDICIFLDIK